MVVYKCTRAFITLTQPRTTYNVGDIIDRAEWLTLSYMEQQNFIECMAGDRATQL